MNHLEDNFGDTELWTGVGGLGAGCSKWRSFLEDGKRLFTKTMTKHLPKAKPRLEKRRQKTTSQGSFKFVGCAGIPCCPWKISKHTSTLVVVGYWAFNLWMAWSALDASGLMVAFTCFHMIFFLWGGWSFFYPKKCMICFFPNRIEEDQAQSLPWWGCSCYKGVHVHMWVDVSV